MILKGGQGGIKTGVVRLNDLYHSID
jgi:hypothetical protein